MKTYIECIRAVAQQVTTSAEAFHLITYIRATLSDAAAIDEHKAPYWAIRDCAAYWDEYGCYEDEIMPAISILHAIAMYGMSSDHLAHIVRMKSLCDDMMNSETDCPDMTYEEFCDKYAEELNQ